MGLHVLVLAGGSGTRLWPLSRSGTPKHLLPLASGGVSLLRDTVERVRDLGDSIRVVTAAAQAEQCRAELAGLGLGDDTVLAEPVARGTGPALGLAVGWLARDDPEALVATVHADHRVADPDPYRAALVASAGWAAAMGGTSTVGLRPTRPATGFGYIELGNPLEAAEWRAPGGRVPDRVAQAAAGLPAFRARGFVEKPSEERAARFLQERTHVWNLGLFAWPAPTFLADLWGADSALATALEHVIDALRRGDENEATRLYSALGTIAVEPLLLERSANLAVVEADFGWSDLGSWADLHAARIDSGDGDPARNVLDGDALTIDASDCTVVSRGGRLVTVVGASGLVVVDTPDALLVVPADQSQKVKAAVDRLREAGRNDVL